MTDQTQTPFRLTLGPLNAMECSETMLSHRGRYQPWKWVSVHIVVHRTGGDRLCLPGPCSSREPRGSPEFHAKDNRDKHSPECRKQAQMERKTSMHYTDCSGKLGKPTVKYMGLSHKILLRKTTVAIFHVKCRAVHRYLYNETEFTETLKLLFRYFLFFTSKGSQ